MELELFPLFDMEAIKSGAKKNKLSTSVKLQTLQGENINSEEELQANSLHVRMTYKNLDFAEKNIKEHEFENCTFESCHFVKANLTAVAFMDCKFQNCDFVVPTLVNTGIKTSDFFGCKFMGVDFSDCSNFFFSPNFQDSMINSCNFEGNKMPKTEFFSCKIRETSFAYCDLSESRFDNSEFQGTTFQDCQLQKADFTDAIGYTINPFTNKLKGARFSLPEAQSFLYFLDIEVE